MRIDDYELLCFVVSVYMDEVERKFHGLRVKLTAILRTLPAWKSGMGVDDIVSTDSSWKFFSDILFLKHDITTRPTKSNLNLPGSSSKSKNAKKTTILSTVCIRD